jgi:hypothetical protein
VLCGGRSLIPTAIACIDLDQLPRREHGYQPAPAHLFLDSFRFTCNYLVEKGRPMERGAHGPPVSLSLLPRTMHDQADVVTHCQARLSKLWGGFFPWISNICDGMRSRGVITQAP